MNVPIVCAGQLIHPGDVVVADDDGVCVVERQSSSLTLDNAKLGEAKEEEKRKLLADGVLGLDIYDMRPRLDKAGLIYYDSIEDWKNNG